MIIDQRFISSFLKNLKKAGHNLDEIPFVFENTGIYSSLISSVLSENELDYNNNAIVR